MKRFILGLVLLGYLTSFSQNIEITGGINKNKFFDFREDGGHFRSSYQYDYGYLMKAGIDDIRVDRMRYRFTLGYEKYSGELRVTDGGLGGEFTTRAVIDKSVISAGFFPLNFKITGRFDLNVGFEISGLINETINGSVSGWSIGSPNYTYDLNDRYDNYSAKFYCGLIGRIAYDLKLSDNLVISPQYSYYFGLSKEFLEFPEETRSMRHQFAIGIQRKLCYQSPVTSH